MSLLSAEWRNLAGEEQCKQSTVDGSGWARGGSNIGRRCKQGTHNFNFSANCQGLTILDPIFDYDRSPGATVIGGYVYHGSNIAALAGNYVFGDFISGRIWSLAQNGQDQWMPTLLGNAGGGDLAGFGRDASCMRRNIRVELSRGSIRSERRKTALTDFAISAFLCEERTLEYVTPKQN